MPADRLVGEAYVLMRADGRLMKGDIKRLATESGKTWGDNFEKELTSARKTLETRFVKELSRSVAEVDFSKFRREFGSVDDTVRGLQRSLNALSYDSITGKLLPIKERQLLRRTYDEINVALQQWATETRRVEREHAELNKHLVSYGEVFQRSVIQKWKDYARTIAEATQSGNWSKLRRENEAVADSVSRITQELEDSRVHLKLYDEDIVRSTDSLKRWADAQNRIDLDNTTSRMTLNGREVRREVPAIVKAIQTVNYEADRFSYIFGRAFGKGSRNNFLNFVGSVVAGMTRLVTAVPVKLVGGIASLGSAFAEGFSAARAAGLTRFAAAGRGIASMFAGKGGIAGAALTAIVAVVGFGKVLPAIVSAISMLAANVVSLVGSVGVGLVGALLAAGPAAVAAAGGLVVLAGAWASWRESAQGKDILEQQKKEFESFFKTLYPAIERFNQLWSDAFLGLGERVRPGILSLSKQLETMFASPTVRGNLDAWGGSIQRMMQDIADATADLTAGLIAFFVPILPYAEKLTGWIAELAQRFNAWASSASGQNAIADFMKDAWAAGKALWDLVREIGETIAIVFFTGAKETGTGWIQGMADNLKEFNDYLRSPEGKKAISDWFSDAKQFGEDIAGVFGSIKDAFKELDSPEGRKTATDILDAVKGIAETAADIAAVADSVGQLVDNVAALASPAKVIYDLINGDAPEIEWGDTLKTGDMQAQFDEMKTTVSTWVSETRDSISQWGADAGSAIESFVTESWASITGWVTDTYDSINQWSTDVNESITTFFEELPGRISTWVSETWTSIGEGFRQGAIDVMDGMTQFLEDLATAIEEFDLGEFLSGMGEAITLWVAETSVSFGMWAADTWETFTTWATGTAERIQTGLAAIPGLIVAWAAETVVSFGNWVADTWERFTTWGTGMGQRIQTGLDSIPGRIAAWASSTLASFNAWVANVLQSLSEWRSRTLQTISDAIGRMGTYLAALPGRVAGWLMGLPSRLTQPFRDGWNEVNRIFDGAPARLASAIGRVLSAIASRLSGVWNTITQPFRDAWAEVQRIIGNITSAGSNLSIGGFDLTPWNASGAIYNGATVVGVGEAGPEAIVPLNRPLSQVDPSVRLLSAIAQGKMPWMASGGVVDSSGGRPTVVFEDGAVRVVTAAQDPMSVAMLVEDTIADALASV